jgi:ABC-2 type transport system ATP-binding protein
MTAAPAAFRLASTLQTTPIVEVEGLERDFGPVKALRGVDMEVAAGEVHALLGPNGAGKTTLMRVLCGLVDPSAGSAYVLDTRAGRARELRERVGFVPSGDRSFYLRLSGLENLVFFGRLHGLRKRAATARAAELLASVGLGDVAHRPISTYSHGMQKRLSFARALLGEPAVLLVDEATHDLDPVAAQQVRAMTRERAEAGAAVLWATQRIEEVVAFADRVTVLDLGAVAFAGTVAELAAAGGGDRHVIRLGAATRKSVAELDRALGALGRLQPHRGDGADALLALGPGVALGAALAALVAAGAEIVGCRDERPPIERAFLSVTGVEAA